MTINPPPKTTEDYGRMYDSMHRAKGGKYFPGRAHGKDSKRAVKALCEEFQPVRVLDYGSGKGKQYTEKQLHLDWGLQYPPICYDVGVPEFRKRPDGVFHGIVCTDMMEHIAERDVDAILADIMRYAAPTAFVYFHIATHHTAKSGDHTTKLLPDGRDPHLTVKPADWWKDKLAKFERPGLKIVAQFEGLDGEKV